MAATPRMKLKAPLDVWSTKERLSLASSVLRSGDQNWVSVSRSIKPLADESRPADWFSTKNCALQYSDLLEKAETPKRKRGDRGEIETPTVQIVRKLTIERIEELKRLVQQEQQQYKKLKREVEMVRSGHCDDQLQELWDKIQREKKEKEEAALAASRKAEEDAESRTQAQAAVRPPLVMRRTPSNKNLRLAIGPQGDTPVGTPEGGSTTENEEENSKGSEDIQFPTNQTQPPITTPPAILTSLLQQKRAAQDISQIKKEMPDAPSQTPPLPPPEVSQPAPVPVKPTEPVPSSPSIGAPTLSKLLGTPPPKPAHVITPADIKPLITKEEPPPPAPVVLKKEVEKQEQSAESAPETDITVDDVDISQPPSPASSVSSKVSESGKSTKKKPRSRPSSRGSRRSTRTRLTRRSAADTKDDAGSRHNGSEIESSDAETIQESDDTGPATTKHSTVGESIPNSPASMSQCSDTEDEKAYKAWKKSIMLVWRAAATHKYANVFLHPVTDDIAPGYHSVVLRPKDLSTIKKNVEIGHTRTTAEFQRDMMLMFTNAIMYNSSDHDVYQMAKEMYDDVMQTIEQFVSTQIMVQSTGPENKYLRGTRRPDGTSDKEDDIKRRRSTEQEQHGGKTKKRKTRADD